MEFQFAFTRQPRHRIGADMVRRELQHCVLARGERQRLGRCESDQLDVVRQVCERRHRAPHDASGVDDDLVRLRDLDGAGAHYHGLAGQQRAMVLLVDVAVVGIASDGVTHIALDQPTAAGTAASRHAAVRNWHAMLLEGGQQILALRHIETLSVGKDAHFHIVSGSLLLLSFSYCPALIIGYRR